MSCGNRFQCSLKKTTRFQFKPDKPSNPELHNENEKRLQDLLKSRDEIDQLFFAANPDTSDHKYIMKEETHDNHQEIRNENEKRLKDLLKSRGEIDKLSFTTESVDMKNTIKNNGTNDTNGTAENDKFTPWKTPSASTKVP